LAFGSNLAFREVNVGESATETLTLYNRGNSDLTIEKLRFHNNLQGAFSGDFSGVISANGEQNITITFNLTTATSYAGLVYIEADKSKLLNINGLHNLRKAHAELDIHSNPLLTNVDALESFTLFNEGAINIKENIKVLDYVLLGIIINYPLYV